ncbi:MAG: phage shock protein operon transcriptional activator [Candidatus Sumerlaeia bacterium]
MADNAPGNDEDRERRLPPGSQEAIGESRAFLDFQDDLRRVAPVERPVLLIGERGTGKEMAARRLHFLSQRWGQPCVTLNCAALSPSLIESELFGHEEGAFTGARRRRRGRFESADGGTLFLDEISLIPIETQEKILRVVEYGSFERVGSTESTQADVRIIGATNVDLSREATAGRFKRDLLDRLSFEVLFLPPLRERAEDIPLLASHFAARMAHELGRANIPEFSEEGLDRLLEYSWPGNIRELKNVVERAVYRADGDQIEDFEFYPFRSPYCPLPDRDHLSVSMAVKEKTAEISVDSAEVEEQTEQAAEADFSQEGAFEAFMEKAMEKEDGFVLPELLKEVELAAIRAAMEAARYSQKGAAEKLGLTYHQFRGLYRKHSDVFDQEKD